MVPWYPKYFNILQSLSQEATVVVEAYNLVQVLLKPRHVLPIPYISGSIHGDLLELSIIF